ncbi:MAG: hypothetical protein IPO60_13070 [Flavobacteriales bacterium]|jgi:hypothetical protein|nr:hypothetical protein [Flavobacteriales bacterium]MBK6892688.1 hypothetical protein [Flavobacteriales bacterium]MBK7246828.1 hypothetical protein [Flavobacteriales bacterium]MBK9599213.1 hypothetical protein [Flavobacteriales bacterium]QQS72501.1 MAG: hypothetical protein IPP95_15250 [Flavobacteriales bacterium]
MKALFTLVAFAVSASALATDRIVEEFGQAPAYSNITAAVAAASDGDRIIVKNRAGNIPWIENIMVNASLQFLSFSNDDFFYVQGNYTITGAADREVTIIGMRNTSGNILAGAGGTVRGTSVRLMDSYFVNGYVNLSNNNFQADIVGCTFMNGTVAVNYGNVVGCDIDGSAQNAAGISISGSSSGFPLDTCAVIGNKLKSAVGYEGIFSSSESQVLHIRNNYIQHGWMGIEVYEGNNTGVQNLIWNNTITAYAGSSTTYGISLANTNTGSVWEVMNNAITRTWSGTNNRGINKDSGNSGQINVYFNHVSNNMSTPISAGFTFASDNTTDQAITLNADGTFASAPSCIDGGNPAPVLSDLDLTTGDAGAYGGSYTLNNFHPMHTGAARVYLTGHPFNVRSGSTLRVKAVAFDR